MLNKANIIEMKDILILHMSNEKKEENMRFCPTRNITLTNVVFRLVHTPYSVEFFPSY